MPRMFLGNAMWHLVQQSDVVSLSVLLLLLAMSIVCWSIFLYKIILLCVKRRQLNKAFAEIESVETMEQLLAFTERFSGTLPEYFLSKNLRFLKTILGSFSKDGQAAFDIKHIDLVQQHAYQIVDDMVHHEERYLSFLSTSAAAAPLLGLFGTVWGLVHAFIRISEQQSADITTVAPGMAEALITTLVGLMVAIPALVMSNYLYVQVASIEKRLESLAAHFVIIVQKLFA